MKRSFIWYVNVALIILVAMLMTCCVSPVLYTSVEMVEMPDAWGKADCDMYGNPIIKLAKDTATYNYRSTLVHEREHARRMRRYGCIAFKNRYNKDRDFAFMEEAHAYCAEAMVMLNKGIEAHVAEGYAATRSRDHHKGQHLTIDSVRKVLPCRGMRNIAPDTLKLPP